MTGDISHKDIAGVERQFNEFVQQHPGAGFREFYVHRKKRSIEKNVPQPTLGANLQATEDWTKAGKRQFEYLLTQGLQPHHTVVDFGCGSLRVGQHLMKYLEPGHYWGLDICDDFMAIGVEQLGPAVIEARKPHLEIISPATCREARDAQPDFVYCRAVLRHVPPAELERFCKELMSVTGESTLGLVTGLVADEMVRISGTSWAHSRSDLAELLGRFGGCVAFDASRGRDQVTERQEPFRSILMRITRRGD